MDSKISQNDINRIAWKACDTFRGIIDPSQYKDYILTMLFLKYVGDVYKAKYAEHLKRYQGDNYSIFDFNLLLDSHQSKSAEKKEI